MPFFPFNFYAYRFLLSLCHHYNTKTKTRNYDFLLTRSIISRSFNNFFFYFHSFDCALYVAFPLSLFLSADFIGSLFVLWLWLRFYDYYFSHWCRLFRLMKWTLKENTNNKNEKFCSFCPVVFPKKFPFLYFLLVCLFVGAYVFWSSTK